MSSEGSFRVAIDMGGTFIDFVLMDEASGNVRIEKIPSLPRELASQLVTGLDSFGVAPASIRQIFHGMTVGINALVQEKGAKVGLITTRGFRDVLEMTRGGRVPVYNFVRKGPAPIVPRLLRREVSERMDFQGKAVVPLDVAEVDREADYLVSQGVEAISVVFLHAYVNPSHEVAVRERIVARHPRILVSLSHEIASVWREYERSSTTVLNSFIQPGVRSYLKDLEGKLGEHGYEAPLAIMQSNGGVTDVYGASAKPIRTIMSGPAGGVIGAHFLCSKLGYRNVVCTDVGGTTFDVAVIENGHVVERSETHIAGRSIMASMIDVTSVGAGGGSIAWLDHRNALQVGPASAGASPGPVCFGRGGTAPTTTDAHVVLGWLDPEYFLGGRMKLDAAAARSSIERLGLQIGLDTLTTARGIVAIAESNMANAIRGKTVTRGLDPREFVMLSYGGGGGLVACAVADELRIPKIIVPQGPATFSAWGILTSDYMEDEVRTRVLPFGRAHIADALSIMDELKAGVVDSVAGYGFPRSQIRVLRRFDLRFSGQEYALTIDLHEDWRDSSAVLSGACARFVTEHRRLFGHGDEAAPIELIAVRCRAIGKVRAPTLSHAGGADRARPRRDRLVHFQQSHGAAPTPVLQRESLDTSVDIIGPVIIEEWTATTVVPPGWRARVDDHANLILESGE